MPELTSIRLGGSVFCGSEFICTKLFLQSGLLLFELGIDLPKLTTFIAEDEDGESFSGVRNVVLESSSSLLN